MTVSYPPDMAKNILKAERAASVEALTQAAFHLRSTMKKEIDDSIDNPTPTTQNAQLFKVNKDQLSVDFYLRDEASKGNPPAKYLNPLVYGGKRRMKGAEKALGAYMLPAKGAQLDQYGNIPRGQVVKMLSDLGVQAKAGFESRRGSDKGKRKARKARGRYIIIGRVGEPVKIIAERQADRSLKRMAILTPTQPSKYEKGTLDWHYVVEKNWPRYIVEEFNKAWIKFFGV